MEGLFPMDRQKFPQGFTYIPDFITSQEENGLLQNIAGIELHPFLFQGFEAKRKVASFGYDYNFDKRSLSEGKPIPAIFNKLIGKVAGFLSLSDRDFAELLITEYPPGSVINWHRDAPPFNLIAGLDEAPMGYKDIKAVMESQKELVEVVGSFMPKIVRMCGDEKFREKD
jgi:hypothetical protein